MNSCLNCHKPVKGNFRFCFTCNQQNKQFKSDNHCCACHKAIKGSYEFCFTCNRQFKEQEKEKESKEEQERIEVERKAEQIKEFVWENYELTGDEKLEIVFPFKTTKFTIKIRAKNREIINCWTEDEELEYERQLIRDKLPPLEDIDEELKRAIETAYGVIKQKREDLAKIPKKKVIIKRKIDPVFANYGNPTTDD